MKNEKFKMRIPSRYKFETKRIQQEAQTLS
jgi:hypothetical protein